MIAPVACVGTSCSLTITFDDNYKQATLDNNVLGLYPNRIIPCITTVETIATVTYSTIVEKIIVTPLPGFLENVGKEGNAPIISCLITFPIDESTFIPRSRPIATLIRLVEPTTPDEPITEKEIKTQITLPFIAPDEIITLIPQVCRVGIECTYRFEISPYALATYPAIHFRSSVPGTWSLANRDYCTFSQSGQHVVLQVINAYKYNRDRVPYCTLHVIPLEQNTVYDPTIPSNIIEIGEYEYDFSHVIPNLNLNIYAPTNPAAVISNLLSTPQPILISDPEQYQMHPLFPRWVVVDIPAFHTVQSNPNGSVIIFNPELGGEEELPDGGIPYHGPRIDVAGTTTRPHHYGPQIEVASLVNDVIAPVISNNENDVISNNETDGDDTNPDEEDTTPVIIDKSVANANHVLGQEKRYIIQADFDDEDASLATKGEESPVTRISIVGNCLATTVCNVQYQFLIPSYLHTIKFTNHFDITDPRSTFECYDVTTNRSIGKVTYSPDLKYGFLTSNSISGFLQTKCIVGYHINSSRSERRVTHRYEFVGNTLNTDDPNTTYYTPISISDAFILPSYSSHSVTVHSSLIQVHSKHNYAILKLQTASDSAKLISFKSLHLSFDHIDTSIPLDQQTDDGAFDFLQVECNIPPISSAVLQPTCRGVPTPRGILINFSDDVTNHNIEYITVTWSLANVVAPFLHPRRLISAVLGYQRDYTATSSLQKQSYIELLSEFHVFPQGQVFSPKVYHSSHDHAQPCTDCNIYLPRDTTTDFFVEVGSPLLPGNIVVFRLFSERKGDLEQQAHRVAFTPLDGQKIVPHKLPHMVCQYCLAFDVKEPILDGKLHFDITSIDSYNSLNDQFRKVSLEVIIKTPLAEADYLPTVLSNQFSLKYQPAIETTYFFTTPQWWVLYDYRSDTNQVTRTARGGKVAEGIQINEDIIISAPTRSPLDTQNIVNPILQGDLSSIRYTYQFKGCWSWKPIAGDRFHKCRETGEIAWGVPVIECEASNATEDTANIVTTFSFTAPSVPTAFLRCTMTTHVEANYRTSRSDEDPRWRGFVLEFDRRVTFPRVLAPSTLAFPKHAVTCDNMSIPFLIAAGPGLYTIRFPSGFSIPNNLPPTKEYSIENVSENHFSIRVGTYQSLLDATQVYDVTSIYIPLQCEVHNDISTFNWKWSYTPFRATSVDNRLTAAKVDQSLFADYGYYVVNGKYELTNDAWQWQTSDKILRADQYENVLAGIWFHTSIRKNTQFQMVPPDHIQFPPFGHSGRYLQKYSFPMVQIDPVTSTIVSYVEEIPMSLQYHPTNPRILMITFEEELDLFNKVNWKQSTYLDYFTEEYVDGVFTLDPDNLPEIGGYFDLGFPAAITDYLDVKQCFNNICQQVGQMDVVIRPQLEFDVQLAAQVNQEVYGTVTTTVSLVIGDLIIIDLLEQDDEATAAIPSLKVHPFSWEDPLSQSYHLYATTPNSVTIRIARPIPLNQPLGLPLRAISIRDATSGVPGAENIDYSRFTDEESIGYARIVKYKVTFIQAALTTVHELEDAFQINVRPAIHSFKLHNGFHIDDVITFSFSIRDTFYLYQDILLLGFPLDYTSQSTTYINPQGYKFDLVTQLHDGEVGLLIRLRSEDPIVANTPITITFPTPKTLPSSSISTIISLLRISSISGVGIYSIPIATINVPVAIEIFDKFSAALSIVGAPITAQLPPIRNEYQRGPLKACVAPSTDLCFLRLDVMDGQKRGVPLPPTGVKLVVDFLEYQISSEYTLPHDFTSDMTEEYHNADGSEVIYTVHRDYSQLTTDNTMIFNVIPVSTTSNVFTHITIPVSFAAPNIILPLSLTAYDRTSQEGLFTTMIRGPSVYPSTTDEVHFFYLNGGSYVNEPLAIGITGLDLIQATTPNGDYDSRKGLDPKANFVHGSFDFGTDNEFDLFEEIGLKSLNTQELITSHVSPINRMYEYSKDMDKEFFGIGTLETVVDSPNNHRSINFHIQALNSFSESEVISLGFTNIFPSKPVNIGYDMTNPWKITTYTNRYFFESTTQQPLVSYNDDDVVTKSVSAGIDRLQGFKIRPKQWLRIIPTVPTINISPSAADNISNTPTTTVMALIIQQQWPKKEEINDGTYADEWIQYELKPDDAVHIIIPPFYTIPVGVYYCDDSDAYLEWAITMFIFHPARFKFPQNKNSDTFDPTAPPPSYRCEFTISVTEANYKKYVIDTGLSVDAEMTLSHTRVSTLDNSDNHLPFLSTNEESPLIVDQGNNVPIDDYFEWFMPMPIAHPRYNIDFNDMSTVGIQYDAQLTITNGYLQDGRSLYYPLESFPVKFSTNSTNNGFSSSCYDENKRDIAIITVTEEYGIEFSFKNRYATTIVTCTFKFTPSAPLEHGGLTLHTDGLLRTVSASRFDLIRAKTTVNIRSTDPLVHLTSIITPHPTVTVKADFIPGLVTRVEFSGKYFSFPTPQYQDGDVTKPVNASFIGLGFGVKFKHHADFIDPEKGVLCLTSGGQPFGTVVYTTPRQDLSVDKDDEENNDQNDDGNAENENVDGETKAPVYATHGSQLQLRFLYGLSTHSEWSCYIDIVALSEEYKNVPNGRFVEFGKPSVPLEGHIINQITFRPRSHVDLAPSHGSETTRTIGTVQFYFNSTTASLATDPKPGVLQFTTPKPMLTLPQFGVTCYLNGVRYDKIPLRPHSITASRTIYSIASHMFAWPTQTGLSHISCTIPSLSVVTQPASDRSMLYFSDAYALPFSTYSVPHVTLLQYNKDKTSENKHLSVPFASNSWFTGEIITPLELNAYQDTPLLFNLTHVEALQPLDLFSASPLQWSLSQSPECISTIATSEKNRISSFYSEIGLAHHDVGVVIGHIVDRDIEHDQCAFTVSANGFKFNELPDQTCNPESAQGCSIMSSVYSRLGEYIPRLYSAKINFAPFFRQTKNVVNAYDLGAIGSVDYEFGGFNADSAFLVQIRSTSNRFMFIAQVSVLDQFDNIINAYQFNTDVQIAADKRNHIIRYSDDVASGCDIIINVNPRWDHLSRLRIAYIGTNIAGSLTATISKTTLATYPATDATFKPHKFTTNTLQQPKDSSTLPISTSNSRRFNKPIAAITAPLDYQTGQRAVVRGAIHSYTFSVQGVSSVLETLPDLTWLDIIIPPSELNSASLEVDYHINAPAGVFRAASSNPVAPRTTSVQSNCVDDSFSRDEALVVLAFALTYRTTQNVHSDIQIQVRAFFNPGAVARYVEQKKTNQLSCQFALAFDAPGQVAYHTSSSIKDLWNLVPQTGVVPRELVPKYIYGVHHMLYSSRELEVYNFFTDQRVYLATLTEGATTMNGYGTFELGAHGYRAAIGDVFIIKFAANKEKLSSYDKNEVQFTSLEDFKRRKKAANKNTEESVNDETTNNPNNDALSTPIDQPYRFAPIPENTPYCYNRLFVNSKEVVGMLYPADPMTYATQLGTYSDTFLLKVTKESKGSTYTSFACAVNMLSLTTVPFEGIIQVQHLTAREYEVLVTSTTPDLIALGFSRIMKPHTTQLNFQTGREDIIYDDEQLNVNTNRLSRYSYDINNNSQDATKVSELKNMGTVLRSCTDALEHPEQTRFCLVPTGIVNNSIKQGITIRVEYDDVPAVLEPVSITFIVSLSPRPENNVYLDIDLTEIKFSGFYGCENFPTASYYGERYTGIDEGILKLVIDDNTLTTSSEVSIKCNFLSSRYIQPSYYLPDNTGTVRGRHGIRVPMVIKYHDKHHTQVLRTGYTGTFAFKSTIRNDLRLIPAINLIIDRTSNETSSYSFKQIVENAYLDGGEVNTLKTWFTTTTMKSVFAMNEDTHPLFFRLNLEDVYISKQNYLNETNNIQVQLGLPATTLDTSHLHYALPFKSATDWLEKAHTEYELKFNSHKMITNFIQKNKNDLAVQGQFLSLTPLIEDNIALFEECYAGQCGGNCQPCNWSAPCYNSDDCGYGLYCELGFADLHEEQYQDQDLGAYTASSITGKHNHVVVKQGMHSSAGICTLIDTDTAAIEAIKDTEATKKATKQATTLQNQNKNKVQKSFNKPIKTHKMNLHNQSAPVIASSTVQSRLSNFIRDPSHQGRIDPDVLAMAKIGSNLIIGELDVLGEQADNSAVMSTTSTFILFFITVVLSVIMM